MRATPGSLRGVLGLAAILGTCPGVSRAQTSLWGELHRMFPPGLSLPFAVESGDLDGDGDPDVVRVGGGSPAVAWISVNDGIASFTEGAILPTSLTNPRDATLFDAEGDLDLDIVVAIHGSGSSGAPNVLFLNDGAGTFLDASGNLPQDPEETQSIAAGDVDGDGDVDLVAGNGTQVPGQNTLYRNDGSGGFTNDPPALPVLLDWTNEVVLGDVDGDGDLDLCTADQAEQNHLLLNDGTGHFTDVTATHLPVDGDLTRTVTLGDVDGDGDLDGFLGNWGQDRLYENQGAGIFIDRTAWLPSNVLSITETVELGDFDGDTDLDALLADASFSGTDAYYRNTGGGLYVDASGSLPAGRGGSQDLEARDLDGDADLDAVAGASFGRLWLNDASASFTDVTAAFPGGVDGEDVGFADVDGDADADAVLASSSGPALARNDGAGMFQEAPSAFSSSFAAVTLALADVDGDADPDAVFGAAQTPPPFVCCGGEELFRNDGTGGFTADVAALPYVSRTTLRIVSGDVDADSDCDLVVTSWSWTASSSPDLLINDGAGRFLPASAQLPPLGADGVDLGDVDGDGDLDAFLPGTQSGSPLWLNDGAGTFTAAPWNGPVSGRGAWFADVDGDQDLDLYVGGGSTFAGAPDTLYTNDGAGGFTAVPGGLPAAAWGTKDLAFLDADEDGNPDAILADGIASTGVLLLGSGAGTFTDASTLLPALSSTLLGVDARDLDGEGDPDLWLAAAAQDSLVAHLGRQLAWRAIPRLGKSLTLDLYGPAGAFYLLLASPNPGQLSLPYGTLHLGVPLLLAGSGALDGGGRAALTFVVPNQAGLLGVTYQWQSIYGFPLTVTNLERTTITNL